MHPVNNNNLNRQQNPIQPQPIHPQNFYNYGAIPNVFINNDNINENINNMQNQMGNQMIVNPHQNMFMNNPNPIQPQMFMNPMQQQMMMQQQHQNFMMQQQMMQQQQQQLMIQQAVQQAMQQQQPIIQPVFQPPVARMQNLENLVQIQEYESSEEEPIKQQPIKRTKLTAKGKGKRKAVSLDDIMEHDLENPARKREEEISKNKGFKGAEAPLAEALVAGFEKSRAQKSEEEISKSMEEKVDNKMSVEVENFLANIFDKSLDANKFKEPKDKTFISKKNNSNVIKSISPKHSDRAHFNKDTHPNEVYNVKFLGTFEEIFETKASDINEYALDTHKYIYEYNKSFVGKVHNTNKLIGFIYARSSSDNTVSIETQRQVCFKFARENNIKLSDFGFQFDNNISARNMNNIKHELGFWKDYIDDGSHVIIYSVDRLSRHLINGMKYLDEMVAKGITFHFVTNELKYGPESTATQKGMIQTLLIEAEKFSNMTSEKVKTTRKRLIAEGNELGVAKYGFKVVLVNGIRKKLLCQEEQENIRKIKEKYQDVSDNFEDYQRTENVQRSFLSIYRFISRWCVRSNIKYRKGQPFSDLKIREIVKSK